MFAVLQHAVSFKKEKHVVYHLLLPFAVSGFFFFSPQDIAGNRISH